MKRIAFLLTLLLTFLFLSGPADYCNAQILVSSVFSAGSYPQDIKGKDMELLENSKTILILPDYEEDNLDKYNEVIKKKWTVNEMEAWTYSSLRHLPSGKYSYFEISGIGGDFNVMMMRLIYNDDSRPHIFTEKTKLYGYFFLSVTEFYQYKLMNSIWQGQPSIAGFKLDPAGTSAALGKLFYQDTRYHNLTPGHLSLYLEVLDASLKNPSDPKYGKPANYSFITEKDPFSAAELQNDTLYIPSYILNCQKFSFGTITSEPTSQEELLGTYPYPYRIISTGEAERILHDEKKTAYFLDFIMILDRGFFTIYNTKTAEVVYSALSRSVAKSKDFGKLSARIKSSQ